MLEILVGSIFWYLYSFNYGLSVLCLLKLLLSKSIKMGLFFFTNLIANIFFGTNYLIFAKIYLLLAGTIFMYENIFLILNINLEEVKEKVKVKEFSKIFNYRKKIQELVEFVNFIILFPFYILYDNLNYYFNLNKYTKQYELFSANKLSIPEMPDLNDFENCSDEELDKMLNNMFNPDKFFELTNNMRENIGKKPLTKNQIDNQMNNLGPLFGMFNNSMTEINTLMKDFTDNKHIISKKNI
jgi:hypothetical protein